MKTLALLIVACALPPCGGCAGFTQAQIALTREAQVGVERCRAALDEKARMVDRFHALQRSDLDAAFDADVRDRATNTPLTGDWVITHRKAYAAAMDALAKQREASTAAAQAAQRNADATRAALDRLSALQATQLRLSPTRLLDPNDAP